jgi:uncharacterized protein (DUF1778 family)
MATEKESRLTVRLSPEEHEAVKAYAFVTDTSINDVLRRSVQEFIADKGRGEQVDSLLEQARNRYRVALDKLADL